MMDSLIKAIEHAHRCGMFAGFDTGDGFLADAGELGELLLG